MARCCPLRCTGEWLDSLLGGFFSSFVVGAASPDGGQPVSFLLKCHACEWRGRLCAGFSASNWMREPAASLA